MRKVTKRILYAVFNLILTVSVTSANSMVYAAPTAEELENTTSSLQNQLNSLSNELAVLSQELDDTSARIETLAAEVEIAKLDLAAARLSEEDQYESMKDRIQFMYEGGNISLIHILFAAESMGEFLNKAEYVNTISSYDRHMLDELIDTRKEVEHKQNSLEEQQAQLIQLQTELTQKQEALSDSIASTSASLTDYSAQLERARAAEAALLAAQNNEISGSIGSNASSDNIVNSSSDGSDTASGSTSTDIAGGNSTDEGNDSISTDTSYPANTSDVALLAAILQCEAGGSGYDGMLAVGTVIMNRVASPSFPGTISEVVYQPGQFSPASSGKLNSVLSSGPMALAYTVAQDVLAGARHSSVINCHFFNAAWTGKPGINIGGNVFW